MEGSGAPARSLTVQTVLYGHPISALAAAVASIVAAVAAARDRLEGPVTLAHGDAGPRPLAEFERARLAGLCEAGGVEYQYVFFGENTGSARGQNRLSRSFPATWHYMTNPDVVLGASALVRLLDAAADPAVGQAEARQLPCELAKAYDPTTGETSWASGGCSLVRGEALRAVGGYDEETFFLHGDDVDLSWRIRTRRWRVLHVPGARVFHDKRLGLDGRAVVTETEVLHSGLAAFLMATKWGGPGELAAVAERLSGDEHRAVREEIARREASGRVPTPEQDAHVATFDSSGAFGAVRF